MRTASTAWLSAIITGVGIWLGLGLNGSSASAQLIDVQTVPRNIALGAAASTNGFLWSANWTADLLTNGVADVIHGDGAGGVSGFPEEPGFSYTIDLGASYPLDGIDLRPRQDGCCPDRLRDFRVGVHADNGAGQIGDEVWATDLFPDEDAPGGLGSRIPLTAADGVGQFTGRFVKVTTNQDPVDDYELQLAEIEVFSGTEEIPVNYALGAAASSNGTFYVAPYDDVSRLTDGNISTFIHGDGPGGNTGVSEPDGFYYELNLGQEIQIAEIDIWPRQDGCCPDRLTNYLVSVHPDNGGQIGPEVWSGVMRADGSIPDPGPVDPDQVTAALDPQGSFQGQWIRITSLDELTPDYRLQIAEIEVFGHKLAGVTGDYNSNGELDAGDLDKQAEQMVLNPIPPPAGYDLNNDGKVDPDDRLVWLHDLKNVYVGDADLNGEFNSADFVQVFIAGKYETGEKALWEEGDWDGDQVFGSADFVAAFIDGGYEIGPRPAAVSAVPEPGTAGLLFLGLLLLPCRRR